MSWLILSISVILLIFVILQRQKIHVFTAHKNIQTFLLPFIYYLKNDVWEDTLLHLQIDMNPNFTAGIFKKETNTYHFEWIKGKTRLMDGSEIQFRIKDIRKNGM